MRIQHNIMAMNAYRNYTNNVSAMKKNLEKLSSGYKINRAGDDAAGLAISEKMRAQITGLETAQKNAKDGISLVQTAEGALTEVHDMLNRMVELATQSANGTYENTTDRAQLQKEMDQLKEEINRIADSSNFNGINLLDGSLATTANAETITINGINSTASAGRAASYVMQSAFEAAVSGQADGNTLTFNIGFNDGTSQTVTLKFAADSNGDVNKLVSEDGLRTYALATDGKAVTSEIANAVVTELNTTTLKDEFTITNDSGKVKLEAKEIGAGGREVKSFDLINVNTAGNTQITGANDAIGVSFTTGLDAGREIAASAITVYNGKNYSDAVFTINGHKFVLLTKSHTGTDLGVAGADMNTTSGLDSDVTILVGGQDGLKNTGANIANFQQNIKEIARVTGLTVTDAINEATPSGVAPNAGIRLSKGSGATGGLVLQIGATADSFNQLRVGIDDCHVDALGLKNVSIANQTDAAAAVDKIKAAINKVSDVRGTLGATQNRLEHTINNLSVMTENIQDAESTIRDTDVAEEMMAYTKNNILIQSAQAMLAQANQVPQGVLQLLQ